MLFSTNGSGELSVHVTRTILWKGYRMNSIEHKHTVLCKHFSNDTDYNVRIGCVQNLQNCLVPRLCDVEAAIV